MDPIVVWNPLNFSHIDSREHSEVLSFISFYNMEKNDLGIEIMFHTIPWRHRKTSEKKKTIKKEFNSIKSFEVIMVKQS